MAAPTPTGRFAFYRRVILRPWWFVGGLAWTMFCSITTIRDNFFPEQMQKEFATRTLIARIPHVSLMSYLVGLLVPTLIIVTEAAYREVRAREQAHDDDWRNFELSGRANRSLKDSDKQKLIYSLQAFAGPKRLFMLLPDIHPVPERKERDLYASQLRDAFREAGWKVFDSNSQLPGRTVPEPGLFFLYPGIAPEDQIETEKNRRYMENAFNDSNQDFSTLSPPGFPMYVTFGFPGGVWPEGGLGPQDSYLYVGPTRD